jgi:spore germination protein YaaH
MKKLFIVFYCFLFIIFINCAGSTIPLEPEKEIDFYTYYEIESDIEIEEDLSMFIPEPESTLPVTTFGEIWGYVIAGQEAALRRGLPITDVGYFGAEVNMYGRLANVPNRQNLSSFNGRVHLTVTCFNYALSYFILLPGSPQRSLLISDLITATRNFDGLNLDFENIPPMSGNDFISFLVEVRAALPPEKILSVCLYGRTRAIANDVYDYERIAPYVDRIFVMGYDFHWSGGPAGPVSPLQWGRNVANHSLRVIGAEKLVMGIPFYGRAWADSNHHRALIYPTTRRLIETHNVSEIRRVDGIPTFNYNVNIGVTVFFEDVYSLSARMEMYKSMGVRAIGFWRIGQETPRIWNILRIES